MGSAVGDLFGLLDHDPTGVLHHIQFGFAEMRVRFLTLGFSFFNLLLTLIEPVSRAVERFSDDVEAIAAEPDTKLTVANHDLLRGKQFGVEFLQSRCFFPLAADAIEQVCSLTHGLLDLQLFNVSHCDSLAAAWRQPSPLRDACDCWGSCS